jgi:hypothetical protein
MIRVHKNAKIKVKIDAVDFDPESSIVVRQVSCKDSVTFLFMIKEAVQMMNGQYQYHNFALVRTG